MLWGAFFALTLSACFSPWEGGDGVLTITLGDSDSARVLVDTENEVSTFHYEVTFTSPGKVETIEFTGNSVSVNVAPGDWSVMVKAYGYQNGEVNTEEEPDYLRAIGSKSLLVKPGYNPPVTITMISATEVNEWPELVDTINSVSDSEGREEIIVIANDLDVTEQQSPVVISRNITLFAEKPVTISALPVNNGIYLFYVEPVGSLNLGKTGMSGTLTINGCDEDLSETGTTNAPLVNVTGILNMYDGVVLRNHHSGHPGGAVCVDMDGVFNMEGGLITGNQAPMGGGVYVNGKMAMSGNAKIAGNTAVTGFNDTLGGGVYVTGEFKMSGDAEISGNSITANNRYGVGVCVEGGKFIMTGGYIRDNNVENLSASGGGVCLYYSSSPEKISSFTMSGGEISGNSAYTGGGICIISGTLEMSGGLIQNNTAEQYGGGIFNGVEDEKALSLTDGKITGNKAGSSEEPGEGGGVFSFISVADDKNIVVDNFPDDINAPSP